MSLAENFKNSKSVKSNPLYKFKLNEDENQKPSRITQRRAVIRGGEVIRRTSRPKKNVTFKDSDDEN